MVHPNPDPLLQQQRALIADLDQKILAALNERIGLVRQLKAHKEALGLGFYDPAQEERLIRALREANGGPLPNEGLEAIYRLILAWTRHAAGEAGDAQAD